MTWRLVTTDFPPLDGGIATWSEGIARGLADAGEDVVVHARASPSGRRDGYQVVSMHGRSWATWQAVWSAASVLPRLRRGDRVLCATWPLAVHLLGPARRLGVPVAVAFHGSDLTRPPVLRGLELVKASAHLHPVSRYLGGLLGEPHLVLPMPVRCVPRVRRGEHLLVVARLGPLKGVDRVLQAAARLGRPVRVVGDGPERPALEALAAQLGVDATFTGRLPREAIPWEGSWACALFSRPDSDGSGAEGLGLVLLEAAARGIPTVGSATGGIPEAAMRVVDPETWDGTLPDEDPQAWLEAHTGDPVAVLRALYPKSPT